MNANGIMNFPYVEPSLEHYSMPAGTPLDNDHVYAEMNKCLATEQTEYILNTCKAFNTSGLFDSAGLVQWNAENEAWNVGIMFGLDCNVGVPTIPAADANRGQQVAAAAAAMYADAAAATPPYNISGVYIDSMEGYAASLDYRPSHAAVTTAPLMLDSDLNPVILNAQSTLEGLLNLSQWVRENHPESPFMMANGAYLRFPQFARAIDIAGTETTWLRSGVFTPLPLEYLFRYRAFSYQKPYLFLQNSDFGAWTEDMTAAYMEASLAFGLWPGFFSANAAENCYFETPALYNRDRHLFQHYIPLLHQMNVAGWEPVTLATADQPTVWVERWGDRLFTIRLTDDATSTEVTFKPDLAALGIKGTWDAVDINWGVGVGVQGGSCNGSSSGACASLTLGPAQTVLLQLSGAAAHTLPRPGCAAVFLLLYMCVVSRFLF
eukprot:TRINITY_DN692_c0_g2_i6.p1 TRINITY_DN692_c0_g2~~TRINITY_DN692_c0_g2_i6.p1  ORF type:complete len:435 (+),score=133.86 TRINITY_DN692_c0_g2_i6:88-1392(+)